MPSGPGTKPLLQALSGERLYPPPIWLMRQAGRYLPEYRALRAEAGSFLDLCYTPRRAAEVTLQPIRRFGFDAAILFSDILIVPHALGLGLDFVEGEGPKLETIRRSNELDRLAGALDGDKVQRVYEAVAMVRAALPAPVALIGFVGGPWTVATYVAAGGGSPLHAEARLWAYRDPGGFGDLIERLVEASVAHLIGQIDAGAEAVQIFDSWAGELPPAEFERWCVAPLARMVERLWAERPNVPIILFPRAAGTKLTALIAAIPGVAIGLDTSESAQALRPTLRNRTAVQGNLDPMALLAGGVALDRAVDAVQGAHAGLPHIFNLGHGIDKDTPIEHVHRLVARVRGG